MVKIVRLYNDLLCLSNLFLLKNKISKLNVPRFIRGLIYSCISLAVIVLGSVAYICSIGRRILQNMSLSKEETYRYHLAIVTIAKNEREYLREWVAFHKIIGVEKIYLYDNDSTDCMIETISDFIHEGFVSVIPIHGKKQHYNAYNDAIKRYGRENKYMVFIDCDEYLIPRDKGANIVSIVDRIISKNPNSGGITVNWRMYGSSGYTEKPEGLCIECFTYRSNTEFGKGNKCIKSIVKPLCVYRFMHSHFPVYKPGWYNIDQKGIPVPGFHSVPDDNDPLRINHYFTKSRAQWIKRRSLGKSDSDGYRTISEFVEHDNNDIEDLCAAEYSTEVREYLQ